MNVVQKKDPPPVTHPSSSIVINVLEGNSKNNNDDDDDDDFYHIRSALTEHEQIEVLRDIFEQSQKHTTSTDSNNKKTRPCCMNPTPKTIALDSQRPTLRFGTKRLEDSDSSHDNSDSSNNSDNEMVTPPSSVYDRLVIRRALSLVAQYNYNDNYKYNYKSNQSNQNNESANANANVTTSAESFSSSSSVKFGYDGYSVGAIRYEAPNGNFPEHIDHCNDAHGWVVLLSLGCTAVFTVRAAGSSTGHGTRSGQGTNPGTSTEKLFLHLQSGDIVVFDPSTKAAI